MSNRLTDENRRAKAGKRFKEKEKKTRAEQIIEQVNEHLDEFMLILKGICFSPQI